MNQYIRCILAVKQIQSFAILLKTSLQISCGHPPSSPHGAAGFTFNNKQYLYNINIYCTHIGKSIFPFRMYLFAMGKRVPICCYGKINLGYRYVMWEWKWYRNNAYSSFIDNINFQITNNWEALQHWMHSDCGHRMLWPITEYTIQK